MLAIPKARESPRDLGHDRRPAAWQIAQAHLGSTVARIMFKAVGTSEIRASRLSLERLSDGKSGYARSPSPMLRLSATRSVRRALK